MVAGRVAPRNYVEVWEAERFVGLVPSPYPKIPTAAPPAAAPTTPATAPPPAPPPAAKIVAEPTPAPEVWDDPTRPFNPFRRGSWRRRMQR